MQELLCPFSDATYLFFSPDVPALIHYSHLVAALSALSIGLFIFFNNPKSAVSRLMLLLVLLFVGWAAIDVILWADNSMNLVMLLWSLQVLLEPLAHVVAFYLFFLYIYKKQPGALVNIAFFILLLPLVVLLPTTSTLTTAYLPFCEAYEGFMAEYYTYAVHLFVIGLITLSALIKIPRLPVGEKGRSTLFVIGLLTFLLAFSSGNILGSFTDDWSYAQYGLYGMPIFASLLAYSIVRFKAFSNGKTIAAQVLVFILALSVISLVSLKEIDTVRIVASLTFLLVIGLGYFLIKSVKKEVQQREQLEILTGKLEAANERLKELDKLKSEFVSIASHQLRSPLTAIRGYASMLAEGSFGKLGKKAQESAERIEESARLMAESVEDYLNVSRIESGNMKYNTTDFNLRDKVDEVADELRPVALKKGLVLLFRTDLKSKGVVHADMGKTVQIIHNLVNNSIKYTQRGSINVFMRDDVKNKKLYVEVSDTGVGMSRKTIDALFQKFSRAERAHEVNSSGTGLGLFVAHKMAEQMGGQITADSEGEGKGSRFTLELPLAM